MDWTTFKQALSDRFTPSELIEMIDIETGDLVYLLEEGGFFDEETIKDLEEILGVADERQEA